MSTSTQNENDLPDVAEYYEPGPDSPLFSWPGRGEVKVTETVELELSRSLPQKELLLFALEKSLEPFIQCLITDRLMKFRKHMVLKGVCAPGDWRTERQKREDPCSESTPDDSEPPAS